MVDAKQRSTQSGSGTDREEIQQLRRALGSSREIGVAIGVVMITYGIDHDAAVAWLKRQSNESNVKLNVLCADLVREASQSVSGAGRRTDPLS
jgi:AmiR/NasT family two-component response regulator